MAKPIAPYGGPAYIVGPQGNKIGVRGGRVVPLPPVDVYDPPVLYPLNPPHLPPVVYPPSPPPRPVITHPHKPPRPIRPMPPIRPPVIQPARPPQRHTWHHKHAQPPRRHHPAPLGPPRPEPAPVPVMVAPPVASGPKCPTWGWMVRTNADGSETVIACTPGQQAAAGLHGLEAITETIQGVLGPNWMLYLGLAGAAWFFLKKR